MHKILVTSFLLFSLNPFVSPIPIATDVQPISALLGMVLILLHALNNRLKIGILEGYWLAIIMLQLLISNNNIELRYVLGLPFAVILYIATKLYANKINKKLLNIVINIHLFTVLWHFIEPLSFQLIADNFINSIKNNDLSFSYRGVSGLTPEPSFAAALSICYIIISISLHKRNKISNKDNKINIIKNIIIIILTQSGLGFLLVILLVIIYNININNIKQYLYVSLLSISMFFAVTQTYLSDTRGGKLLNSIFQDGNQVLYKDQSIGHRMLGIETGLRALMVKPLGFGSGQYAEYAPIINHEYGLSEKYSTYNVDLKKTVSAFGRYTLELGVLFIILILLLYKSVKLRDRNNLAAHIISLSFILSTFSITFPITYLLLNVTKK